jgi:hypothetical protein
MRATWFARESPSFFVIGAQKSGSSALFSYLLRHPSVTGCKRKEPHYFTINYMRGHNWYRGQFPLRTLLTRGAPRIVGEATPDYLFDVRSPERLSVYAPDAKLIAILRDPVSRAFSHYQETRDVGLESLSFSDALDREEERLAGEVEKMRVDPAYVSYARLWYSYTARGLYMEQVEHWQRYFSREQLLLLVTEDLLSRPAQTMQRVQRFLEVDECSWDSYPIVNTRSYAKLEPDLHDRLASIFAEPNRALYAYLGRDLNWSTGRAAERRGPG